MNATLVRMLSTNALSAFTAANTTSPIDRTRPARLLRGPFTPSTTPAQSVKHAIPSAPPAIAPPRGTLLNIYA